MSPPHDFRFARFAPGMVVVSFAHDGVDDDEARSLTAAEAEVLALAATGLRNAAIAERRKCSARTVANLLARAYRKLGVSSRAAAAAKLAFEEQRRVGAAR